MITSEQVRMARAALKWSVAELSRHAGVAAKTVIRYENGGNATTDSVMKMKVALEHAGVVWVPENGGAAGVSPPRRREP